MADDILDVEVDLDASAANAGLTKTVDVVKALVSELTAAVEKAKQLGITFESNATSASKKATADASAARENLKIQRESAAISRQGILNRSGGQLADAQLTQYGVKAYVTALNTTSLQVEAQIREASMKAAQRLIRTSARAMDAALAESKFVSMQKQLTWNDSRVTRAKAVAADAGRITQVNKYGSYASGAEFLQAQEDQKAASRQMQLDKKLAGERLSNQIALEKQRRGALQKLVVEENRKQQRDTSMTPVQRYNAGLSSNEEYQAALLARRQATVANTINPPPPRAPTPGSTFGSRLGRRAEVFADYAGIAIAMGAVMKTAEAIAQLDDEMHKLQAVTGASNGEILSFRDSLLKMGESSRFSVKELSDAATELAKTGMSIGEVLKTLPSVTNLAAASGSTLEESVQTITTALDAFNLQGSQAAQTADMMTTAINRSKLTITQLNQVMSSSAPIAKANGVSIAELTAVATGLADAGLKTGIALGPRQILQELTVPNAKMQQIMKDLGISMQDIDIKGNSLMGVMENLRAKGFGAAEAMKAFGLRGASSFTALMSQIDNVNAKLGEMSGSNAATKGALTASDSLSAALQGLGNVLLEITAKGASPFIKAMTEAAHVLTHFLSLLSGGGGGKQSDGDVLRPYVNSSRFQGSATSISDLQDQNKSTGGAITALDDMIGTTLDRRAKLQSDPRMQQQANVDAMQAFGGLGLSLNVTKTSTTELIDALRHLRTELATQLPTNVRSQIEELDKQIAVLKEGTLLQRNQSNGIQENLLETPEQARLRFEAVQRGIAELEKQRQTKLAEAHVGDIMSSPGYDALNKQVENLGSTVQPGLKAILGNGEAVTQQTQELRAFEAKTKAAADAIGQQIALFKAGMEKEGSTPAEVAKATGELQTKLLEFSQIIGEDGDAIAQAAAKVLAVDQKTQLRANKIGIANALQITNKNNFDQGAVSAADVDATQKKIDDFMASNKAIAEQAFKDKNPKMSPAELAYGLQVVDDDIDKQAKVFEDRLTAFKRKIVADAFAEDAKMLEARKADAESRIAEVKKQQKEVGVSPAQSAAMDEKIRGINKEVADIEKQQIAVEQKKADHDAKDGVYSPTAAVTPGSTQDQIIKTAQTKGMSSMIPFLLGHANAESGFDPNAAAKTSTASGVFQLTRSAYPNVDSTNVQASTAAIIQAVTANDAAFLKTMGAAPTDAQRSLMLQQGQTGGLALLQAPTDAKALDVLTKVYGGNTKTATAAITNNGGDITETAAKFVEVIEAYYTKKASETSGLTRSSKGLNADIAATKTAAVNRTLAEETYKPPTPTFDSQFTAGTQGYFKASGQINPTTGDFKTNLDMMAGYWQQTLGSMDGAMSNLFDGLARGTTKARDLFRGFAQSIVGDMLKIASTAMSHSILQGLFGNLGTESAAAPQGLLSALFGGGGAAGGGGAVGKIDATNAAAALPGFARGGFLRAATGTGISTRDSVPVLAQPGEFILRQSAVGMIGKDNLEQLNALGNQTISRSNPKSPPQQQLVPHTTNVFVVSPDQAPQMGPRDVVAAISADIQNKGPTRTLIRSVVSGAV